MTETKDKQRAPWRIMLIEFAVVLLAVAATITYRYLTTRVSIDRSLVQAPVIAIAPTTQGTLDELYVRAGDKVTAGQNLARVGGEMLSAKVAGEVILANNTPGQLFSPALPVVKMIVPSELRIVGTVKENEGLSDIRVGDPVTFTVDTFGGQTFTGVVESIDPTSKDSGITFSISDKRETKEFAINVKYDVAAHPEFKNGMSAKMQIFIRDHGNAAETK